MAPKPLLLQGVCPYYHIITARMVGWSHLEGYHPVHELIARNKPAGTVSGCGVHMVPGHANMQTPPSSIDATNLIAWQSHINELAWHIVVSHDLSNTTCLSPLGGTNIRNDGSYAYSKELIALEAVAQYSNVNATNNTKKCIYSFSTSSRKFYWCNIAHDF